MYESAAASVFVCIARERERDVCKKERDACTYV